MSNTGTKTPDEIKDYSIDWSKDIGTTDAIPINGSAWSVSPASATITQSSVTGGLATVWISGGVAGQVYEVKNLVVTSAGRSLTKAFRLLVVASNYL